VGRRIAAVTPARPHVLLVCPGLEHARRGFETFARECFEALRERDDLRIELVKATGARAPGETVVRVPTRRSRVAQGLASRRAVNPFVVEHLAFGAALIPLLARRRPDVVYFSEWHVGRVLGAWRQRTGRRFALVFCNGGLVPGGYDHLDRVQQLTPGALEYTVAGGEPAERQRVLPLGVAMEPSVSPLDPQERERLRRRLHLPLDRRVVLGVGAINRQKRVDVLIEAIAAMPAPRPFLLLAGQAEAETPALRHLAATRIGPDGHDVRTVPPRDMPDLYRASDAFVLASLWESFGRVLVEAQSHGLPSLAHDDPVMRWVLGEAGETADLREPGAITRWLQARPPDDLDEKHRVARHRAAYERFSWDRLAGSYAAMLRESAEDHSRGADVGRLRRR
jgi:1,2-diacylglycerol 3-alpha-glucosyltransferase